MRQIMGLCIIVALLSSCASTLSEKKLVPFDKMKIVMLQLLQVDEFYNRTSFRDSTLRLEKKNIVFYKQVFELNGVDRNQFYTSLEYYENHPNEMKVLMDSVNVLCKKKKEQYMPQAK